MIFNKFKCLSNSMNAFRHLREDYIEDAERAADGVAGGGVNSAGSGYRETFTRFPDTKILAGATLAPPCLQRHLVCGESRKLVLLSDKSRRFLRC
jgi:hypothetical protein